MSLLRKTFVPGGLKDINRDMVSINPQEGQKSSLRSTTASEACSESGDLGISQLQLVIFYRDGVVVGSTSE